MNKNSTVQLRTGQRMPTLGLGTWQLSRDTAATVLYALDLGYRLIDTSSDYGTQPEIGQALAETSVNREDIFITTKVEETDNAYQRSVSNLEELGLDYVNLMLIHRPPPHGVGQELWEGLIRAKAEGLVKDIGVSNYSEEQIDQLIKDSGEVPTVNQIEWSPFGWSREMYNYCKNKGIIIQAYSPLTRAKRLDNSTLDDIADKYGKTPAQVVLRWNLHMGVVAIPKANQKEHLQENIEVFNFALDQEDINKLSSLNEYYSSLGSLAYA